VLVWAMVRRSTCPLVNINSVHLSAVPDWFIVLKLV
jgi:hypothetical protein